MLIALAACLVIVSLGALALAAYTVKTLNAVLNQGHRERAELANRIQHPGLVNPLPDIPREDREEQEPPPIDGFELAGRQAEFEDELSRLVMDRG